MIIWWSLILIPDLGSWLFTAADLLHVAKDVTTDTCVYVCNSVTQAMSVGFMIRDVISLSRYVSAF